MNAGAQERREPRALPASRAGGPAGERLAWILLGVVLAGTALVRWRLLDAPLERDEGEYAYIGRQLLRGEPPYASAYNMKLPGVYVAYALVMAAFGETLRGIHLGLLVASLLSTGLVFALGRRLLGAGAGLAAATVFAALALSEGVQGAFANAEHFVLVPALAGCLLLVRARDAVGGRALAELFLAGFLFGTAFVVKQHGLFLGLGAGVWLASIEARGLRRAPGAALARLALFALGCALPYGLVCAWMALAGVFDSFWFWTFTYAREYAGVRPWSELWKNLHGKGRYVVSAAPWLWALGALGLTALAWDARARRAAGFLLLLALGSFLALTPGFHFRPHYFVLALPAVALLAGALVGGMGRRLVGVVRARYVCLLAALPLLAALSDSFWRQRQYLFELPPAFVTRKVFSPANPFAEALPVANFVREATAADEPVAIFGSEPEIWFYADRRAAAGYVYVYALMEPQPFALQMQRDMIRQLEASRPNVLVFVRVATSWLGSERSHREFPDWIQRTLRDFELVAFMPVGLNSRLLRGPAIEALGPDRPKEGVVEVYRRR